MKANDCPLSTGSPGERVGVRGKNASRTSTNQPLLRVHFLTPILLRTGSGITENGRRIQAIDIREKPPLGVLIRQIRNRFSSLCAFFGTPWETDFAAIGNAADSVELVNSTTRWVYQSRRSTRTGQSHELSGLVGSADYRFPNPEIFEYLYPLLLLGQSIHAGKNAPWGNGAIRLNLINGTSP